MCKCNYLIFFAGDSYNVIIGALFTNDAFRWSAILYFFFAKTKQENKAHRIIELQVIDMYIAQLIKRKTILKLPARKYKVKSKTLK